MAKLNRPDFILPENPPNMGKNNPQMIVDWDTVETWVRNKPGEWFRVVHEYHSDSSARFSAAQQSKRRGLDCTCTVRSRQEDGGIGIFVRYPKGE